MDSIDEVFKWIGLVVVCLVTLILLYKISNNLFTFVFDLGSVNLREYGKWAVVTGCTDGIGKAYADEFAKRGISLVLISRSLEKLTQQSIQLMKKYPGVKTRIIAIDFSDSPESIYPQIQSTLNEISEIGILVNNVGVGHFGQYFHEFASSSDRAVEDLVSCNVLAVTKMTAMILPKMLSRQKGLIINISSTLGRFPTPLMSAYSASKAYVDFFSRSLMGEYSDRGVHIQSLCPSFVSTKMTNLPPRFWSPSPSSFVKSALKTIRTQPVSCGCLVHNIQCFYGEWVLPRWVIKKTSFYFTKLAKKMYFIEQTRGKI